MSDQWKIKILDLFVLFVCFFSFVAFDWEKQENHKIKYQTVESKILILYLSGKPKKKDKSFFKNFNFLIFIISKNVKWNWKALQGPVCTL